MYGSREFPSWVCMICEPLVEEAMYITWMVPREGYRCAFVSIVTQHMRRNLGTNLKLTSPSAQGKNEIWSADVHQNDQIPLASLEVVISECPELQFYSDRPLLTFKGAILDLPGETRAPFGARIICHIVHGRQCPKWQSTSFFRRLLPVLSYAEMLDGDCRLLQAGSWYVNGRLCSNCDLLLPI